MASGGRGRHEALPFPDRSFDVAVSQFGLMFFTDRDKAIHEMLRVMAARRTLRRCSLGCYRERPTIRGPRGPA
jgi:hypothetical protein